MFSKSEYSFGFILKNIEEGGFRYFYADEKKYLAGPIETGVHQGLLGKAKRQQN